MSCLFAKAPLKLFSSRQNSTAWRVTGVWLEIGALSCVEERAVRFSFDIACQGL